ncbi:MAG: AAA family ATPase [bacterium]|nr:AAA family ATPase [bacterium]
MIRSERIAKKINENVKVWVQDHAKLIVVIDGYAGSGKTTVADYIAKRNSDVAVLHLDDFIKHWKERKKLIEKAKDKYKVFEYSWYRYGDLEKITRQLKSKKRGIVKYKTYDYDKNDFGPEKTIDLSRKVLVIDGIFLLHHEHKLSKFWDKRVYLDVDFDKADRMRIAREKKKWGREYLPESHSDNWTRYFKTAYRRYVKKYKPQEHADVMFRI